MIKFIMAFQLMFFLIAGTQIIHHGRECAKVEATNAVYISLPMKALSEIRV